MAAMFFGSYAVSALTDLIGYFDPLLFALLFTALAVDRPLHQLLVAALVTVVGSLIHEQFVPAFLPLALFPALFQLLAARRPRSVLLLGTLLVAGLGLGLAVTLSNAITDPADLHALHQALVAKVDFPLREDFFSVLTNTPDSNRQKMAEVWQAQWWKELFKVGMFVTFPTIAALLAGALYRIGTLHVAPGRRWALGAYAVVAGLSPLSLHFVAWDALRWDMQALVTSFGVLLVSHHQTRASAGEPRPAEVSVRWFSALALSMMLINAAAGGGLEAGRTGQYPFLEGTRAFMQRLTSGSFQAP